MLVETAEPVVIAGWRRGVYDVWMRSLAVLSTGRETAVAKVRSVSTFLAGESDVMLMSLRSSAGLAGLQARAAHVVVGELDCSPQVRVQVTRRLHRTGQQRPVIAHHLQVDSGSDPVLVEMLGLKTSQSDLQAAIDRLHEATPLEGVDLI